MSYLWNLAVSRGIENPRKYTNLGVIIYRKQTNCDERRNGTASRDGGVSLLKDKAVFRQLDWPSLLFHYLFKLIVHILVTSD